MNAGMGTDLFSAYSEPESINVNQYDFDQRVENVRYSPDIQPQTQPIQESQHIQQPTQQLQQQPPSKSMIYDQSELLQDINESALKEQMHVLKQEIETHKKKQQMQYRENYEKKSLIDAIFNKKKEMIRFFSIALIIVLALSMHEIFSEFIKEYIDSNDLSKNKEIALKFLYPISIFIIAWGIKVFSK
tara:strand:- start:6294 stop:6857 length:564 start_codon:yes stop_codon:yes gene_type:complete